VVAGGCAEGTNARPLDGGALTQRGARAPARGPAAAPYSLFSGRHGRLTLVLSHSDAVWREKGRERMNLGFLEGSGRGVFYPTEKQGEPSIGDGRPRASGPASQPRRERARGRIPGPGLGCGLGAGVRWRARMGRGKLGRVCWRARAREQAMGRISLGHARSGSG